MQASYRPSDRTIRLIAGDDHLSSLLHESGHVFLDELVDDALTVADGHRLRTDALTALRWTGFQGSIEEWQTLTVDGRRSHHERWAEGFLTWLKEGKAPVPRCSRCSRASAPGC